MFCTDRAGLEKFDYVYRDFVGRFFSNFQTHLSLVSTALCANMKDYLSANFQVLFDLHEIVALPLVFVKKTRAQSLHNDS